MTRPTLRLVTKEGCNLPASKEFSGAQDGSAAPAAVSHLPDSKEFSGAQDSCVSSSEQLCFSFDVHRIEIVSMDDLHGKHLCEFILLQRPKIAIDLRYVIRFDLPGTSREQVLNYFRSMNTLYVIDSIPWHEIDRKDFISDDRIISQKLEHEIVEKKQSPAMLFVPKDEHVDFLSSYLKRVFAVRGNGCWEIGASINLCF